MSEIRNEILTQRRYYAETAHHYNAMHVNEQDEHFFALSFLAAAIDYLKVQSVLDIGSGTGRSIIYLKKCYPNIHLIGIEPVKELREIGYSNGISETDIIDGDATNLQFSDNKFDLVCEFGMLHHVRYPDTVISEMLRVAKKAIFISDSNNFGQGSYLSRSIKQMLNFMGLWKAVDLIKTRGKGYTVSEGDGIAYSYSVFTNYRQIKESCKSVHLFNTKQAQFNFYKTAGHIALLGIKE